MTINIKVGKEAENPPITLSLKIRKTIDGQIIIADHDDIDIVIFSEKKKIISFPKSSLHDEIYACQERLFNFLAGKGVIKRESVQSGDVYGSLQAEYPEAVNGASATQLVVFNIGKFLEAEKPHIEAEKQYEEEFERSLTNPDEEESTELGEVPQKEKKGTIDPQAYRKYPYGFSGY